MNKRAIGVAIGVVIGIAIAAGIAALILSTLSCSHGPSRAQLDDTREQARQATDLCDASMDGLATTIAMGTSHFGMYLATNDRANLARVMTDVIVPVVSTHEVACVEARTLIERFRKDTAEPDRWIDAAADRIELHLAHLAQIDRAMTDVRAAVASGPTDVIQHELTALTTAINAATPP